ncbi:hypothetical protein TIFTF001_035948 [Ficus carica]|uniref:Uncharacterized protein n=1 Tax=Ficus carica TaxID=3494 RepID=A0AA88EBR3_FICCA|nr:hypothetical protein TIFTF001_035948 [Ficus carica]
MCTNEKEKVRPFHFDKRPTPKFHSFGSAIPIMIFLPLKGKAFPFWPVVGEEGFEPPTPWFVADLYAFHRSTGNSLCPYRTPAWRFYSVETLFNGTLALAGRDQETTGFAWDQEIRSSRKKNAWLINNSLLAGPSWTLIGSCRNKVQVYRSVRMPQLHTSLHFHLTPIVMINGSSRRDLLLNSQNFCRSTLASSRGNTEDASVIRNDWA